MSSSKRSVGLSTFLSVEGAKLRDPKAVPVSVRCAGGLQTRLVQLRGFRDASDRALKGIGAVPVEGHHGVRRSAARVRADPRFPRSESYAVRGRLCARLLADGEQTLATNDPFVTSTTPGASC